MGLSRNRSSLLHMVSPRIAFIETRGSKMASFSCLVSHLGKHKRLGAVWGDWAPFFLGYQWAQSCGTLVHFHVAFFLLFSRAFSQIAQSSLYGSCHPRRQNWSFKVFSVQESEILECHFSHIFGSKKVKEPAQIQGEGRMDGSSSQVTLQKEKRLLQ